MRLDDQRRSSNIEDRRGAWRGGSPIGGMRLPLGRGGLGCGGLLLLLVIGWFAGIDPLQLLGGGGGGIPYDPGSQTPVRSTPAEQAQIDLVSGVLASTEDCWREVMPRTWNRSYEEPRLVLFRDGVRSACGFAETAVGPFYCPGDRKVYLDLAFFDELQHRLGAGGDFAEAYVIAHEVGHHVQQLLGEHRTAAPSQRDSIRLELQADYYAGVWAHHASARGLLDVGDYEEAIAAARAVGDDTLQRRATGRVMPERFTHGTAAQRQKWFRLGFETGDPKAHDPFVEER